MRRSLRVNPPVDKIALRRVSFAVELLDAVTLDRVSRGVTVIAQGLQRKPILNAGGLFVWLNADTDDVQGVLIDPGVLPYEAIERSRAQLNLEHDTAQGRWPLTSIELAPRVDYPFGVGVTGLRGTLLEGHSRPEPVPQAEVQLRWVDQDGNWHDAPTTSHTTAESATSQGGDFVTILRLPPSAQPLMNAGSLTVRLRVKRGENQRDSGDLSVLPGRVTTPSIQNPSVFAWDQLNP